ncbi:hypothetical protein M406DRAFT_233499, partial [Cryphonectria parasitica EP155]
PQLTLFHAHGACSLVLCMLLKYVDLPFNSVLLVAGPDGGEAADGSFNSAEYRAIHHSAYVPALKITPDGIVITELVAIAFYISRLVPERKLIPASAVGEAQFLQWMTWLTGTLHGQGYGMVYRPTRFAAPDLDVVNDNILAAIRETGRRKVLACYEWIESNLSDDGHMIGGELSIVDFYLVVFYGW